MCVSCPGPPLPPPPYPSPSPLLLLSPSPLPVLSLSPPLSVLPARVCLSFPLAVSFLFLAFSGLFELEGRWDKYKESDNDNYDKRRRRKNNKIRNKLFRFRDNKTRMTDGRKAKDKRKEEEKGRKEKETGKMNVTRWRLCSICTCPTCSPRCLSGCGAASVAVT